MAAITRPGAIYLINAEDEEWSEVPNAVNIDN